MTNYKQNDGYDKYHTTDVDDKTTHRGKATYDSDGTLKRLDIISPASETTHHHEWLKKKEDGSYEYGHGEHENH